MKANCLITILLLLLTFAGFIIFQSIKVNKRGVIRFCTFYSSNINDTISCEVTSTVNGTRFCVRGVEFYFYPEKPTLKNNHIFSLTAKRGDYIYKPPFSDTLLLKVENGEIFKFTFDEKNSTKCSDL